MSIDTHTGEHTAYLPPRFEDIRTLEDRLERGWAIIEEKSAAGSNVSALERHWLQLLDEYETLCDRAEQGQT